MTGWAFLVARGRYTGYQTVLLPAVLAGGPAEGILNDHVRAGAPDGPPTVTHLHHPVTGDLTVVHRSHRLQHGDIDADAGEPHDAATDQDGRWLDMAYGFIGRATTVHTIDEHDLRNARAQALVAYRDLLDDEDAFTARVSPGFVLRSTMDKAPPARGTPAVGARPTPARRLAPLILVGVLAAFVAVLATLLTKPHNEKPESPRPTCTAQTAPASAARPDIAGCRTSER
jgi:hypothetical protein